VAKAGTGGGTVTSSPSGINCGADCSEVYALGTRVTLIAMPTAGSVFNGWSAGGCSGTADCTVTLTASANVTALFQPCPSGVTLRSPATAVPGATVTVTWCGIPGPTTLDWIGLFGATAPDTAAALAAAGDVFLYVNSCGAAPGGMLRPAGSCRFTIPGTVPPGAYQLRLFPNDQYTPRLAVSNLTLQ
jgi:hypothetical protein